jgi:hypothetical protein
VRDRRGSRVDDALQVRVDHRVERRGVELGERPVGADPRVGDDDVELAEALDGGVDRRLDGRAVADVAGDAERPVEAEVVIFALTRPRTMRLMTTTFRPMSEGSWG